MAIFNITSKPYVCPSVSMRVETLDSCNMYIYVDKVEGLSDYAIYVDNTRAFFQPSGVLETETYFPGELLLSLSLRKTILESFCFKID